MGTYCLRCHSAKVKKGSLDLERFTSAGLVRKDPKPWQLVLEMVEAADMPPADKPQPTPLERQRLIDWVRGLLNAEANAHCGDPGFVPLRRLSNTEFDCTVRDLTGVDLKPTRQFPPDGAGGEGFTNAAESLTDISPALLTKYLGAAREIAAHAVLLPDGFRFSPAKSRRDWSDESTARLRQFYATYATGEGHLLTEPFFAATLRHRAELLGGRETPEQVAAAEHLNPKYLRVLGDALLRAAPSHPLDAIRARWRSASLGDGPALAAEVAAWQAALWNAAPVGSYTRSESGRFVENLTRQHPSDPVAALSVPIRLTVKPATGQTDVTIYLVSREGSGGGGARLVWGRPRFEAGGKAALLCATMPISAPRSKSTTRRFSPTARSTWRPPPLWPEIRRGLPIGWRRSANWTAHSWHDGSSCWTLAPARTKCRPQPCRPPPCHFWTSPRRRWSRSRPSAAGERPEGRCRSWWPTLRTGTS